MTDQDRWEENAGASPFTLSVTIAALVALADFFEAAERDYVLSLADCWNERIESWTYTSQGEYCAGRRSIRLDWCRSSSRSARSSNRQGSAHSLAPPPRKNRQAPPAPRW